MKTSLFSVFVQDDWRVAPSVKVLYGVRYDLYNYPDGDPDAPFEYSRSFTVDRNNFGPRVGVAWTLRRQDGAAREHRPHVRPAAARRRTRTPCSRTACAPTRCRLQPDVRRRAGLPGRALRRGRRHAARAEHLRGRPGVPDACRRSQNNVQIDRAFGTNYSASIGFVYVTRLEPAGRHEHQPDQPRSGRLADGRPIYSTAVSAATRRDPRFNQINTVQSIGESTYKGVTLQVSRRFSRGIQFDLTYTLGKGEDNAPLTSTLSVQGDDGQSRPEQPGPRQGPEHPRHAPHLLGEHRGHGRSTRAATPSRARSSTTTSSASCCSSTAASR